MKLTTEYHDPRDLAIALLSDSDPEMIFLSETMEWVDYLGSNPEFTIRALDYFVNRVLESRTIKTDVVDSDLYNSLLDNIARLSAKAQQERNTTKENTNV